MGIGLFWGCTGIVLSVHKALLSGYRALWSVYRALLSFEPLLHSS